MDLFLPVDQNGVGLDLAVAPKDDFAEPPALAFDSDSLRDIDERQGTSWTPRIRVYTGVYKGDE